MNVDLLDITVAQFPNAECKHYGDIMVPRTAHENEFAKTICTPCIHKSECLELALLNGEHGIWGGTDETERALIRKERGVRVRKESHELLEIQHLLETGESVEQVAKKLGIKVASLKRTLRRARGLL